ncbi:MAG: hypothetical protein KKG09_09100 [Verrucomicrobia bacterium]|nr:hypothetical protein [Verrucomicrobiota bacterium]MCG2680126.1 hypothetical protein [Kiritimatiellia bacterium]MBU4247035.1 hypothetical protein [Verrucomicrobiota bacterium]MBU4291109.1 hypothetical protein [Verrucomicrobiota bacterium]MBU4429912.1 hypothetical protein [Verrucomicrobiota bacterium]
MTNEIVPAEHVEIIRRSEVPSLMDQIRPSWKTKNLITRVQRLLEVDPSSACQRILNAAIHDLREKIIVAGLDIAKEAAIQAKLPPVATAEDLEHYPTAKLVDLAYKIGFLSRPEWRRLSRCYEIRRDLEHEDDEYEAGIEDCVYVFRTCIDVVLSRDPVQLLRVTDVKDIVEGATPAVPTETLLEEFRSAPAPRQEEILKFLMSVSLNKGQSEIVQQNAFTFLTRLSSLTQNAVRLSLAKHLQEKIGRTTLDRRQACVASAMGLLSYLKRSQVIDFFDSIYNAMHAIGTSWGAYEKHGDVIRSFTEVSGFIFCPDDPKEKILKYLVLTYLGSRGGRTTYGNVREVFYSNSAAPLIEDIITTDRKLIADALRTLRDDRDVKGKCEYSYIARRFENLIDLLSQD